MFLLQFVRKMVAGFTNNAQLINTGALQHRILFEGTEIYSICEGGNFAYCVQDMLQPALSPSLPGIDQLFFLVNYRL